MDATPIDVRLANALVSYGAYVAKMLWPVRLAVFYPYPNSIPAWQVIGAFLGLACALFFAIREARRWPYFLVRLLWYLGTLVPVIGPVQVGSQAMADRYTYVPLIGLFVAIAWAIPDLVKQLPHQQWLLRSTAMLVLIGCAFAASAQVRHWENGLALWSHTVVVTKDNHAAETNLGVELAKAGKLQEAVSHYTEAIRIKPDYRLAYGNLGPALAAQGKFSEAVAEFNEALRLKARDPALYANLGLALAKLGKDTEAITEYTESLGLDPDYVDAHNSLANALVRQGKIDEAISHYEQVLRINPAHADAHNNLGVALAMQGRTAAAIKHFTEALRLKPDYQGAKDNLARAQADAKAGGR